MTMNTLTPSLRKKRCWILLFCFIYVSIQLFNIVHAYFRDDKRFGFWMFAESSRFKAQLYRELNNGKVVKTDNGRWHVRAEDGSSVQINWDQHVQDFRLDNLESYRRAKTGLEITMQYLEHALHYFSNHIPEDQQTRRLVLKVQYRRAGGTWEHREFVGPIRLKSTP